ncbi:primase C-terminal domain-containing protein [Brevibacillus centrosporus]|uniref:primase C-terminal domain-containing protein n=1 Tax=Brevibacillus centrosporus TaxID=54910 RepID=UPI003D1F0F75
MLASVIEQIYENTLTTRAKAAWQRMEGVSKNQLGWVFFAKDNKSFDTGVPVRTYLTLSKKVEQAIDRLNTKSYDAPYITFNSFGIRKKMKKCLRWLNAVSIEIDNPDATLADIMYFCQMFNLTYPSLVIKSPNGLHLHWLIEREPAFKNKLEDYDLISSALKKTFSWINADAIGAERYWRMPTSYNVLYEHEDKFSLAELKEWAMDVLCIEHSNPMVSSRVKENKPGIIFSGVMQNPAIRELLRGVPYGYDVRNKTAFTLALALYTTQDMSEEEVYTYLTNEWNHKNEKALSQKELRKTVRSACSGRYKGVKTSYVNEILEAIGSDLRFKYQIRSEYKGETQYTKRSELMERILEYVKQHGGEICISQRKLANEIGAAFKSVQLAIEEIKQKNMAEISTKSGRAGGTIITLLKNTPDRNTEEEQGNACIVETPTIEENEKVVPIPSQDPITLVKSVVSCCENRRITINDLYNMSGMASFEDFFKTLMKLIGQNEIMMVYPERDSTAYFKLTTGTSKTEKRTPG